MDTNITNNTADIKKILKSYLSTGKLEDFETLLNQTMAEIAEENEKNQIKIQKARDLDAIVDSIVAYLKTYYKISPEAEETFNNTFTRANMETFFEQLVETVNALLDEDLDSLVRILLESMKPQTKAVDTTSRKSSVKDYDNITKFCRTFNF